MHAVTMTQTAREDDPLTTFAGGCGKHRSAPRAARGGGRGRGAAHTVRLFQIEVYVGSVGKINIYGRVFEEEPKSNDCVTVWKTPNPTQPWHTALHRRTGERGGGWVPHHDQGHHISGGVIRFRFRWGGQHTAGRLFGDLPADARVRWR